MQLRLPIAWRSLAVVSALALAAAATSASMHLSVRSSGGVHLLRSAAPAVHSAQHDLGPVTGTEGTVPPNNPPQNVPPSPNFLSDCSGSAYDNSTNCTNAVLQAIANARAQEGLGPMQLPSGWYSETPQQQMFVAVDLERTARGLPPFSAMATALDSSSQQAAAASEDPSPPAGFPWTEWGGNWAGAVGNPLEAIYYWMYDDGEGSNNIDCTPSNTSGCWGHRDNVLIVMNCQVCVAGTGYVGNGYEGYPSWTALMVASSGNPQLDDTFGQLMGDPSSDPSGSAGSVYDPSIAIGPSGLPTVAVQGPNNALWLYWQASNAQWYGPLQVGETYGAPSIAIGPSGLPTVAVQGPNNALWLYWQAANAQWYGPLQVGQTVSSPSIAIGPSGLPTVAVQGPGNALWLYWQASNAQWYGPLQVGETVSSPSIAIAASGLPTVAAQGPGNALWLYWMDSSAQWYGPLQVGETVSAPSLAFSPSGLPTVAAQGPGNALWLYWMDSSAQWHGPLGVGETVSAPSLAFSPSGLPTVGVEGPGNTLWLYWMDSSAQWHGPLQVGGGGSSDPAPSLAIGPSGLPTVATEADGNLLWLFWQASNAQWNGPLGVS
jgi:hypothetical protein